ncbi:MAG: asparaginase [Gemmatimonadetes bacterium]|nr:asparaginase [Gemmatimonadota bacterium]
MESTRRGHVVVVNDRGELVYSIGDDEYRTFYRSAVKPFQVLPLMESDFFESFGFEDRHIAIMVASHSSQPEHTKVVREVLKKAGVTEADLECGAHAPAHEPSRDRLARAGRTAGVIHNNCSGKHAGMLALAKGNGWPLAGYIRADHPVQIAARRAVEEVTGVVLDDAHSGIDGCGIPAHFAPIRGLAHGFARMATGSFEGKRKAAMMRVRESMMKFPLLVAGEGRGDTDVMAARPGAVFSKVGAKGILGMGIPERGLGVAIKIEDGFLADIGLAAMHVLRLLGISPWDAEGGGRGATTQVVRNWAGNEVGTDFSDFTFEEPVVMETVNAGSAASPSDTGIGSATPV